MRMMQRALLFGGILFLTAAASSCRWSYRYLPNESPRPARDRLFEDCDRRGLSHAECNNEMGCSPEMTRLECKQSLRRRLDMMSHD